MQFPRSSLSPTAPLPAAAGERLSRVRQCVTALFLVRRPRPSALAVGGALRGRPRVLPLHLFSGAALLTRLGGRVCLREY